MGVRNSQSVKGAVPPPPWLLFTFTLPSKRGSQRVEVWRLLRRYGSVPLGNSGYLLPNDATNLERFEWLAAAVRKYTGQASVVFVQSIDNLTSPQLERKFNQARDGEYGEVIQELAKYSGANSRKLSTARLGRLRSRVREISEIDFFGSSMKRRAEQLLSRAGKPVPAVTGPASANPKHYIKRVWVTRPRPGIDRSASAWLIRKFIDKKAKFVFAPDGAAPAPAVPFDMFFGGFGHRGEDCTFETLQKEFGIRDPKVSVIAQMIHDADIVDDKFGRKEAFGIDEVLKGWGLKGWTDQALIERGIEMIEGLYNSL